MLLGITDGGRASQFTVLKESTSRGANAGSEGAKALAVFKGEEVFLR